MRSNLEFGLNILSLVQICKWSLQISNRAKRGIFFLKKKKKQKKKAVWKQSQQYIKMLCYSHDLPCYH